MQRHGTQRSSSMFETTEGDSRGPSEGREPQRLGKHGIRPAIHRPWVAGRTPSKASLERRPSRILPKRFSSRANACSLTKTSHYAYLCTSNSLHHSRDKGLGGKTYPHLRASLRPKGSVVKSARPLIPILNSQTFPLSHFPTFRNSYRFAICFG
jgi:hypothetical protein